MRVSPKLSGATKKFTVNTTSGHILPITPTSTHYHLEVSPTIQPRNKMSEGEVDVAAVSGYEVLPKEVLAEVGSVKLFSTFFPDRMRFDASAASRAIPHQRPKTLTDRQF